MLPLSVAGAARSKDRTLPDMVSAAVSPTAIGTGGTTGSESLPLPQAARVAAASRAGGE